jgi:hypothetical protein
VRIEKDETMFKPRQFGRTLWVLRNDRGESPGNSPSFKSAAEAKRWLAENGKD